VQRAALHRARFRVDGDAATGWRVQIDTRTPDGMQLYLRQTAEGCRLVAIEPLAIGDEAARLLDAGRLDTPQVARLGARRGQAGLR